MNDEALFPSMIVTPTATPPAPTAEAATEASAALVFPSMAQPAELPPEDLSAELQALRAADPGRAMFGDVSSYSAAGIQDALAAAGIEGQAAEIEHRAWAGVLADLEVPPAEAPALVALANLDYPDEATAASWQASAAEALVREFGPDANAALADAKLLVARDPRLAKFLDETGLGSHPDVVVKAARIARSQIMSGKLKRKA